MSRIVTLLREPLVLFSLTAAAVFGLHAVTAADQMNAKMIEVRPEAITGTIAVQQELVGRPFTMAERDEVVDRLIQEEILVREAAARGLHLHNSKTRQRLVTQMYFVMTEDAPAPRPEDLSALYEKDPNRYRFPESVNFDHVFFETDQAAAQALMQQVAAGAEMPEGVGDKFWLGSRLEYYAPAQIRTVLGAKFGAQLKSLEPGKWAGPSQSGRGWHLVRLDEFNPPQPLPPDELDRKLREDSVQAYRARSFETRLDDMQSSYTIVMPTDAEIEATQTGIQAVQVASKSGYSE